MKKASVRGWLVSRSSWGPVREEGGELACDPSAERDVDPEPFASLGHLAFAPCERMAVEEAKRLAYGVVATGYEGRQRVEHSIAGVGRPYFQHLVPVLLDGLPGDHPPLPTSEDASQQERSVL